jgi:uncharacterized protein YbjT (DUF2867 family)
MNILLTGANGFIGRYLLAGLQAAGHHVVPAVRYPAETDRLLPAARSIKVDFNRDTRPSDWSPRLTGIDAVINCAGILQGHPGQSIEAIHATAPKALFTACRQAGVKRVIQISAISAEHSAGTAYASTKREADDFLAASDLNWVILRPSLVYAEGAYGGTALLRALAALPFLIPVIGGGDQAFQPIHVDDLTATILAILERSAIRQTIVDPVGPETLTMRRMLLDLRRWLGFLPVPVVEVPLALIRAAARTGDILGRTVNTTALRQLEFGNVGSLERFVDATGIQPRRWHDALLARPSQSQDRWHARIYFLRPLLRLALAGLWIVSGLVGLRQPASAVSSTLASFGLVGAVGSAILWASCLLDVFIGTALVFRLRPGLLAIVQLAVILGYTIGLTYARPALWFDPFGPLLKNLPIMIAIPLLAAMERER